MATESFLITKIPNRSKQPKSERSTFNPETRIWPQGRVFYTDSPIAVTPGHEFHERVTPKVDVVSILDKDASDDRNYYQPDFHKNPAVVLVASLLVVLSLVGFFY